MNDTKIKVLLVEPEKYPKEIVIDRQSGSNAGGCRRGY